MVTNFLTSHGQVYDSISNNLNILHLCDPIICKTQAIVPIHVSQWLQSPSLSTDTSLGIESLTDDSLKSGLQTVAELGDGMST